jgi:hypothetical protein
MLALDPTTYLTGAPITAMFAAGPGNGDDWIAVYAAEDAAWNPPLT